MWCQNFSYMFFRLSQRTRDGQTDRWTDRQNYDPQNRASIAALRGKNCGIYSKIYFHILSLGFESVVLALDVSGLGFDTCSLVNIPAELNIIVYITDLWVVWHQEPWISRDHVDTPQCQPTPALLHRPNTVIQLDRQPNNNNDHNKDICIAMLDCNFTCSY